MRCYPYLLGLLFMGLAFSSSLFSQTDSFNVDEYLNTDNLTDVDFYSNVSSPVVKLNDSIINVNTGEPIELPFGKYHVTASARGHQFWEDTIHVEGRSKIVRITMEKTEAFKKFQKNKSQYYTRRIITGATLPLVLTIGGIMYVDFKNKTASYEEDIDYTRGQVQHFKIKYENALALDNIKKYKGQFYTMKEIHEKNVKAYRDYIEKSRIRLGVMSGVAIIASYMFYKFFTYEKPTYSEEQSYHKVSFKAFKNSFYDAGISVTFNF